jgi:hypothetical protein
MHNELVIHRFNRFARSQSQKRQYNKIELVI